jgi:drug/metabolite transporter (DMT)-like permease
VSRSTPTLARLALVVAVLSVSFAAPLVRLSAPAPALTVASLRVALAAVLLNLVAPRALISFFALPRRDRALTIIAGVLLGMHFGVWIGSLYFTSVASSVTLVAMQPLFAAIFGAFLLGDPVGRRAVLGIARALVGTVFLAGGDLRVSGEALVGDALAVLGAVTAAAYLVVGRRMRAATPLVPYLAVVNTVAALVLLAAALAAGAQLTGFSTGVYAAIAGCAVVPSLIGHTLLNWSVRRTPAHLVTLAILGEPVGAVALAWLLVGESPPWTAAIGGAIILGGIAVGFSRRAAV